jgi:hypothetical protein
VRCADSIRVSDCKRKEKKVLKNRRKIDGVCSPASQRDLLCYILVTVLSQLVSFDLHRRFGLFVAVKCGDICGGCERWGKLSFYTDGYCEGAVDDIGI